MRTRSGYAASPVLLLCLGIVVVGAIAAYAYRQGQADSASAPVTVATPTPTADPTANWKTYSNATNGTAYTLKYPATAGVYDANGTNESVLATPQTARIDVRATKPTNLADSSIDSYLTLTVTAINTAVNSPSAAKDYFEKQLDIGNDLIPKAPTGYAIGGQSGFMAHVGIGGSSGEDVYVVEHAIKGTGATDAFFFVAPSPTSSKTAITQEILNSFTFAK